MKIYLNGQLVDRDEAKISVFDHGLLYGDGVFEGIRIYDGCVFKLDEHLERLEYSAKALMLKLPLDRSAMSEAVLQTCRANNLRNGYIRLVVTRGVGSLGLSPDSCKVPQVIIIADTISLYPESYYTEGLRIITVPTQRTQSAALSPMIKSLNYLNNIMAKLEAQMAGCMEAIMLNERGFVAEGTGDNVFILQKGVWYTPFANSGALKGITRQTAIEIAEEEGWPVKEVEMARYDLWTAQECFLTGTAAEVVPVVEIDGRIVGSGRPGPETAKFIERYRARTTVQGTML